MIQPLEVKVSIELADALCDFQSSITALDNRTLKAQKDDLKGLAQVKE